MSRQRSAARLRWRSFFVLAGVLVLAGGSQHPDAVQGVPYNVHTADMTADAMWVPAHLLMLAGFLALFVALLAARGDAGFRARAGWTLTPALVGAALSVVELVFHTAAKVDHDALLDGGSAPIALTHESLAVVAYPVLGLSLAFLAWRLATGAPAWMWVVAAVGIAGGLLQAVSAPLVIGTQDQEYSPIFKGAILICAWLVATGIAGLRTSRTRAVERHAAPIP